MRITLLTCFKEATFLIAFATAIAEVPADAITNTAVLIGSNAGIAIRVITRNANAPPATKISRVLLIFLQTTRPAGHK